MQTIGAREARTVGAALVAKYETDYNPEAPYMTQMHIRDKKLAKKVVDAVEAALDKKAAGECNQPAAEEAPLMQEGVLHGEDF